MDPAALSSSSSSSRKSNKIRDIVRLQQILKKWKKAANSSSRSRSSNGSNDVSAPAPAVAAAAASKSIKFLKKTLSFSDITVSSASIPKGYVAVCVGKELERFVIPTEYLGHQVFGVLLREAEEEFGFQQEGVLKFPCEVHIFHKVLKMMQDDDKRSFSSPSLTTMLLQAEHADQDQDEDQQQMINCSTNSNNNNVVYSSPDTTTTQHRPQMCR